MARLSCAGDAAHSVHARAQARRRPSLYAPPRLSRSVAGQLRDLVGVNVEHHLPAAGILPELFDTAELAQAAGIERRLASR